MSNARIEMTYEKIQVGDDFLMRVYVGQSVTTPETLRKCLKVRKGSSTTDEVLWSVAEYSELYPTIIYDELPATVKIFSSASIPDATIQIGDRIVLSSVPDVWNQYYPGYSNAYTVTSVSGSAPSIALEVSSPFPAFGRNMTFRVYQSDGVTPRYPENAGTVSPIDGVANRDYTGLTGNYFLANESAWNLGDDLQTALDKQPALEAQAQSLVDAVNTNEVYLGTDTEVYE